MSEARRPHNKLDIDEDFIRDNYDHMSAREIGEILGVSREAINHRVMKMGLRKTRMPYVPLDGEEMKVITDVPYYGVTNKSRVVNLRTNTLVNPKVDSVGYLKVHLFIDKQRFERRVHRLVAQYFIPNPSKLPMVNHIDGDKTNADINNLEWVTPLENSRHALQTGLLRVGEDHLSAKITEAQAKEIIADCERGLSTKEVLCKHSYATKSIVEKIRTGERWKHLKRSS